MRSNSLDGELKSLKFKYDELLEDNKIKTEKLSDIEEKLAQVQSELDDASAKVNGCLMHVVHYYCAILFYIFMHELTNRIDIVT